MEQGTTKSFEDEMRTAAAEQREKLDKIFRSVERTRKYFQWTLIVTVAAIVLPLIGLAFVIPAYLSTLTSLGAGL